MRISIPLRSGGKFIAICALALGGAFAAPAAHADVVYLITGQSNANDPVDTKDSRSWIVNEATSVDFGGGDFVMKTNGATAPAVLSLYDGTSNGGTLIDSISIASGTFTASFAPVQFHFSGSDTLLANHEYFVELTSETPKGGSTDYKIKGDDGTFSLVTAADAIAATDASAAPEPISIALFSTGLAGLGLVRRRRGASGRV